jgi:hypothetical protein
MLKVIINTNNGHVFFKNKLRTGPRMLSVVDDPLTETEVWVLEIFTHINYSLSDTLK